MKKELVDIYAEDSNNAVMRHPQREFAGSLIQGDSLHILIEDIRESIDDLKTGNVNDSIDALESILEKLEGRMEIYKKALKENGIELPFNDTSS